MKSFLYSILCMIVLVSCQNELPDTTTQTTDTPTLSIKFNCEGMEVINSATRALSPSQERTIRDLNIYLFHRAMGIVKHEYVTYSRTVSLNLSRGEYDVYAIANYGSNMGNRPQSEVANFKVFINNESALESNSALMMSGYQRVSVTANSNLSIELRRIVAKVDVSINVVPDFNFTLHSARVVNTPQSCSVHNGNSAYNLLSYDEHTSSSFSFYMFENLQGKNNSIATEQQKNKDAAPSGATYLYLLGACEGAKVEYSIYLGENNTTDFNVYRNKNYSYSIYIKGINDVDSRVNVASITASDFLPSYIIGETATSTVNLSCTENSNNSYSISYNVLEGNGTIYVDGVKQQNGVQSPFLSYGQKSKTVALIYSQTEITPTKIRITAQDKNGFLFSRDLITQFIELPNLLELNNLTNNDSRGGGKSNISFEIAKKEYSGVVKLKYELIKGVGNVKYKGMYISNNVEVNALIGDNLLEFTPTEIQDAELKLTVTLDNGETISKNVLIKVFKMVIEARIEKKSTDKYGYFFYVDNIPATLNNSILPEKSCTEIRISTNVSWICNSCSREVKGGALPANRFEQIKPNNMLISYGYWLTAAHPTTVSIEGCGNPGCVNDKRSARLSSNSGTVKVQFPVTKFVTFVNIPTL